MFHIRNAVRIAEYILLSVLTLSTGCLAAAKMQIDDNHKEVVMQFSSRSLLDTWDDYEKNFRDRVASNNREAIFYFLGFSGFAVIVLLCGCCIKYGCNNTENEILSGTVLHPPPRTAGAVVPPPSNYYPSSNLGVVGSGSSLVPPRTSRSIILPYEGETFPSHLYGIDNPNYQPINAEQYFNVIPIPEPPRQNQAPLCDIMDMPPPYDTVVKEDIKYPKS